jgi:hypothetical protein
MVFHPNWECGAVHRAGLQAGRLLPLLAREWPWNLAAVAESMGWSVANASLWGHAAVQRPRRALRQRCLLFGRSRVRAITGFELFPPLGLTLLIRDLSGMGSSENSTPPSCTAVPYGAMRCTGGFGTAQRVCPRQYERLVSVLRRENSSRFRGTLAAQCLRIYAMSAGALPQQGAPRGAVATLRRACVDYRDQPRRWNFMGG